MGTPTDTPARARLRDRYRGTLIGLTVGNTLGVPVEAWPCTAIRERYPRGLQEIDPKERELPWDDDAAQAVLLAECILQHDTVEAADFAERLVRWERESGRGIGGLTATVIQALADGVPPDTAARQVWEEGGRQPAGNGAVMRCAPVAMRWRRESDRERLRAETERSAVVTHYDPRCAWSAYAVNLAVGSALTGRRVTIGEIEEDLSRAGAEPQTLHAVREAAGRDLDHLGLYGSAMGFTLKAMQVGLWCLEHGDDFEETVIAVIGAGGDTDTNAAVAGAVLGARHGAGRIPARWISNIAQPEYLTSLADRLLDRAGV